MTSEDLERALRDTLSRRATRAPHPVDLAGTAIRRGRRGRRRRTLTGVAAAALATVLVSAGVFSMGGPVVTGPQVVVVGDPPTEADLPVPGEDPVTGGPSAPAPVGSVTPAASAPAGPQRVEMVIGRRLVTGNGQRIELPGDGPVTAAHRTSGGWLVVGRQPAGRSSLWYVTTASPARRLLTGLDRLVVAPDGRQLVWRVGDSMFAGTVVRGVLLRKARATVPAGAEPVSFAGAAVLLRPGTSGGDLWWPATGEYGPAPKTRPVAAYGTLPGGNTFVAAVAMPGRSRPCLAVLDAGRDLAALATDCAVPVGAAVGSVSPDGRWLLTNVDPAHPSAGQRGNTALLVDLATLGATVRSAPAGPILTTEPVWTDASTAVHLAGPGEVVRVAAPAVADGGEVERFPAAADRAGDEPILVAGPA